MSDAFEPGEIRHDLGASAPGSLATYNVLPCEPDPDPGVMPPCSTKADVMWIPRPGREDYGLLHAATG